MTTVTAESKTEKRRDMFSVKPENLVIEKGFNLRKEEDYGDIESLALSIKANGLKVPLRVYRSEKDTSKMILVDGHRREKAIRRAIELGAEIQFVDVVLEPRKYNKEERIIDMIVFNDGLQLSPLAKAEGIKILLNYGWDIDAIATKLVMSRSSIDNLIGLANAPAEIKREILDKKISDSAVITILKSTKKEDKKVAVALVKEAVSNAKKEGEKKGKVPKMATVKHVKSTSTVKGTLQILNELADYIVEKEITGEDVMRFLQVLQGAKDKKGNKALVNILQGK